MGGVRSRIASTRPATATGSPILVESYFDFAATNRNLWLAIYDHRMPPGEPFPENYVLQRRVLTGIVEAEIARVLPPAKAREAPPLARSLLATVHGHCTFALNGTFALLGEEDPQGAALARVRESLARGWRARLSGPTAISRLDSKRIRLAGRPVSTCECRLQKADARRLQLFWQQRRMRHSPRQNFSTSGRFAAWSGNPVETISEPLGPELPTILTVGS